MAVVIEYCFEHHAFIHTLQILCLPMHISTNLRISFFLNHSISIFVVVVTMFDMNLVLLACRLCASDMQLHDLNLAV